MGNLRIKRTHKLNTMTNTEYEAFLEVQKHNKAALDASDRVIKLLEEQNASLSKELSERCESFDRAKEIALDAAIEHFKGLTLIGQGSSGGVLAMAESVYQWLITDSIKQDNNG